MTCRCQASHPRQPGNGVDNEWLTPEEAKAYCPPLNIERNIRYPVLGAALQRRGGTARHDAVAWGYARAADAPVSTSSRIAKSRASVRNAVRRDGGGANHQGLYPLPRRSALLLPVTQLVLCMAGAHAARKLSAAGAGVRADQTGVPCVVMSDTVHAYISQSDKGELVIGAGTDQYTTYTPERRPAPQLHTLSAICEMFPIVPSHADAAHLGRHRRRDAGPVANHGQDAGARVCTSTAAGAPAASRQRRVPVNARVDDGQG